MFKEVRCDSSTVPQPYSRKTSNSCQPLADRSRAGKLMLAERLDQVVHDTVFEASRKVRSGNVNREQTLEELVTLWAETTGNIDSYYFTVQHGRLISPNSSEPIINSIQKGSAIDNAEYAFFEKFEDWAARGNTENAIWASFAHQERSPYSKFIISTRQGEQILNRAILTKLNQGEFMKLSHDLLKESQNSNQIIFDPERLRSELIVINDNVDWIQILEKHLGRPNLFDQIRSDNDLLERQTHINKAEIYFNMMKQGYSPADIVARMQRDQFVSDKGYSCPPGAKTVAQALGANALTYFAGKKEREWKFDKDGKCLVCDKQTKVGPCNVCESCNDKIDAGESVPLAA